MLATVTRSRSTTTSGLVLLRADSAFYGHAVVSAAPRDQATDTWISSDEVAEIPFTAFSSKRVSDRILGCLVVRRIPELKPFAGAGQPTLFDTHRQHAIIDRRSTPTSKTVP